MSEAPTPANNHRTHLAKKRLASEAIDELTVIKNQARLGIHMWERDKPSELPEAELKAMERDDATIAASLAAHNPRDMLSFSLLPSTGGLPCSLRPFRTSAHNESGKMGYLLDLRQNIPADRMIIPRISERSLEGWKLSREKTFNLECQSRVPALYNLQANRTDAELIDRAVGPEGAAITEQQLDILNRYIHGEVREHYPTVIDFNELVGVVKKSHVKAIVMPCSPNNPEYKEDWCIQKLNAAVAGLLNIARGYDLPVVVYHVKDNRQNEFSLLGQGRREFLSMGLEALREIVAAQSATGGASFTGTLYWEGGDEDAIKAALGVDVRAPIEPQLLRLERDVARAAQVGR